MPLTSNGSEEMMLVMEPETEVRGKVLVIDDELGPRESLRILL